MCHRVVARPDHSGTAAGANLMPMFPSVFAAATLARVLAIVAVAAVSPSVARAQATTPDQPSQPEPSATSQPAQPAQASAPSVNFTLDGGLMFWQIKPDKTADFEHVLAKLKEALQKSEDPARKQLATGWKVYKVQEPAPGGNVFYLMLIDPAAKGADYSSAAILKILYDTFPTEAQDLYKRMTESSAGGRNVLNLQLITNMAQ
jgi:hypothetical protein